MSVSQLYASLTIPQIEIIFSKGMASNFSRLHARTNVINVMQEQVMYSMFLSESLKIKILKTFRHRQPHPGFICKLETLCKSYEVNIFLKGMHMLINGFHQNKGHMDPFLSTVHTLQHMHHSFIIYSLLSYQAGKVQCISYKIKACAWECVHTLGSHDDSCSELQYQYATHRWHASSWKTFLQKVYWNVVLLSSRVRV